MPSVLASIIASEACPPPPNIYWQPCIWKYLVGAHHFPGFTYYWRIGMSTIAFHSRQVVNKWAHVITVAEIILGQPIGFSRALVWNNIGQVLAQRNSNCQSMVIEYECCFATASTKLMRRRDILSAIIARDRHFSVLLIRADDIWGGRGPPVSSRHSTLVHAFGIRPMKIETLSKCESSLVTCVAGAGLHHRLAKGLIAIPSFAGRHGLIFSNDAAEVMPGSQLINHAASINDGWRNSHEARRFLYRESLSNGLLPIFSYIEASLSKSSQWDRSASGVGMTRLFRVFLIDMPHWRYYHFDHSSMSIVSKYQSRLVAGASTWYCSVVGGNTPSRQIFTL